MTELTPHPQPMFHVLQMPHESFMATRSTLVFLIKLCVCLALSEMISAEETDHLRQTLKKPTSLP